MYACRRCSASIRACSSASSSSSDSLLRSIANSPPLTHAEKMVLPVIPSDDDGAAAHPLLRDRVGAPRGAATPRARTVLPSARWKDGLAVLGIEVRPREKLVPLSADQPVLPARSLPGQTIVAETGPCRKPSPDPPAAETHQKQLAFFAPVARGAPRKCPALSGQRTGAWRTKTRYGSGSAP